MAPCGKNIWSYLGLYGPNLSKCTHKFHSFLLNISTAEPSGHLMKNIFSEPKNEFSDLVETSQMSMQTYVPIEVLTFCPPIHRIQNITPLWPSKEYIELTTFFCEHFSTVKSLGTCTSQIKILFDTVPTAMDKLSTWYPMIEWDQGKWVRNLAQERFPITA